MMPEKPVEELYDTQADPWEMNNLADDPEYRELLEEMKSVLFNWMITTKDLSLLPEAEMHRRAKDGSPYDMGKEQDVYPVEDILEVADLVGRGADKINSFISALESPDPAIRYWAAVGLVALGEEAKTAEGELMRMLNDNTPCVRFAASEALVNLGNFEEPVAVLSEGLSHEDPRVKLLAVQTMVALGDKVRHAAPQLEQLVTESEQLGDIGWYMREAATWLLSTFE